MDSPVCNNEKRACIGCECDAGCMHGCDAGCIAWMVAQSPADSALRTACVLLPADSALRTPIAKKDTRTYSHTYIHMERRGMPDYQREQPEPAGGRRFRPGRRDDDGARQLFLDAGRVLMLWGWAALAAALPLPAGRTTTTAGPTLLPAPPCTRSSPSPCRFSACPSLRSCTWSAGSRFRGPRELEPPRPTLSSMT
jgi:hypothetical protein